MSAGEKVRGEKHPLSLGFLRNLNQSAGPGVKVNKS
jgi:hypothetical protein